MAENNKFRIKATTSDGRNVTVEADKFARDYDAYVSENPGARITMYDVDGKEQSVDIAKAKSMYGKGYSYTPNQSNHHAGKIRYDRSHPKVESAKKEEDASPSSVSQKAQQLVKPKTDGGIGVEVVDVTAPKVEIPDVSAGGVEQPKGNMSQKEIEQFMADNANLAYNAQKRNDYAINQVENTKKSAGKFNIYGATDITNANGKRETNRMYDDSRTKIMDSGMNANSGDAKLAGIEEREYLDKNGAIDAIEEDLVQMFQKNADNIENSLYQGAIYGGDYNTRRLKQKNEIVSQENFNKYMDEHKDVFEDMLSSAIFDVDEFGNKMVKERIKAQANKYGMSVNGYISRIVTNQLAEKIQSDLMKRDVAKYMPKNTVEYLFNGLRDSALGMIMNAGITTKSQRAAQAQANEMYVGSHDDLTKFALMAGNMGMSLFGDLPLMVVGGGVGTGMGKGIALMSRGIQKGASKIGSSVVQKIANSTFGNLASAIVPSVEKYGSKELVSRYENFLLANMTRTSWYGRELTRGLANQPFNMGFFMGAKGAESEWYAGDNDSALNLLSAFAKGAASGAAFGAVTSFIAPFGRMASLNNKWYSRVGQKVGAKAAELHAFIGLDYAEKYLNRNNSDADMQAWKNLTLTDSYIHNGAMIVGFGAAGKIAHGVNPVKEYAQLIKGMDVKSIKLSKDQKEDLISRLGGKPFMDFADVLNIDAKELKKAYDGREALIEPQNKFAETGKALKTAAKNKDIQGYLDAMPEHDKATKELNDAVRRMEDGFRGLISNKEIPWETRNKISIALFGVAEASRPLYYRADFQGDKVVTYSANGEAIDVRTFKDKDERDAYISNEKFRTTHAKAASAYLQFMLRSQLGIENGNEQGNVLQQSLEQLDALYSLGKLKSTFSTRKEDGTKERIRWEKISNQKLGEILHELLVEKDPSKMTEDERLIVEVLGRNMSKYLYDKNDGKDVPEAAVERGHDDADELNAMGDEPKPEVSVSVHENLTKAQQEYDSMLKLKAEQDRLLEEGDNAEIVASHQGNSAMETANNLREDGYAALADIVESMDGFDDKFLAAENRVKMANIRYQAFLEGIEKHINEAIDVYFDSIRYKGGNGDTVVPVTDGTNEWYLRDGEIDENGKISSASGMVLVCDAHGNIEYRKVDELSVVTERIANKEQATGDLKTIIEQQITAEYGLGKQGGSETPVATEEAPVSQNETSAEVPTEPVASEPEAPSSEESQEMPMTEDGKPDYMNATTEQTYNYLEGKREGNAKQSAELHISQINTLEKALKKTEEKGPKPNEDVDEWLDNINAQKDALKSEKDYWTAVKEYADDVLKNKTVEAVASVVEGNNTEGENVVGQNVIDKWNNAKKVVGRKGSVTVNGKKITGQYVAVESDGLTPSHDANNDYKQNEGFPTTKDGRSSNSRQYNTDTDRSFTDGMAENLNGEMVRDIPIVQSGIPLDGNGRVTARQKAAKNGTDAEYIESLKENIEGFGIKAEDIEGMEHPTVVFVPDEKFDFSPKTFDFFNKDSRKSESSSQEAVRRSRTLTPEEVGGIIAEMDSYETIEKFYKDANGIDSLLKTLVEKGIIGENEIAGLKDGDKLSAAGEEFVENLILGSMLNPDQIEKLGIEAGLRRKVVQGMNAIMQSMKLGEYSINDELSEMIDIMYNAKRSNTKKVIDFLSGKRMDEDLDPRYFGKFPSEVHGDLAQILAIALDGKISDFRDLMRRYNDIIKEEVANNTEGTLFGFSKRTKDVIIKQFAELIDKENGRNRKPGENPADEVVSNAESNARNGEGEEPSVNEEVDKPEVQEAPVVDSPVSEIEDSQESKDAKDYISKHFMTEDDIDSTDAPDNRKALAKEYLNGTNVSGLAQSSYRSVYNKFIQMKEPVRTDEDLIGYDKPKEDSSNSDNNPVVDKPVIEEVDRGPRIATSETVNSESTSKPMSEKTKGSLKGMEDILAKIKKAGNKKVPSDNNGMNAYNIDKLNDEQNDLMLDLLDAGAKLGFDLFKDGLESKDGWKNFFRENLGESIKDSTGFDDKDVEDLLEDLWNSPYKDDESGVSKRISEWAKDFGVIDNETNNGTEEENAPNVGESNENDTTVSNTSGDGGETKPVSDGEGTRPNDEGGEDSDVHRGDGGRKGTNSSGNKPKERGGKNTTGNGTVRGGGRGGSGNSSNDGGGTDIGNQPDNKPTESTGVGRNTVNLSQEKVPYVAASDPDGKHSIGSVIPSGVASAINESFKRLVEETKKNITDFVRDELGYSSNDEMLSDYANGKSDGLASEQVDSVALAINAMKKGKSFIIGDMTGVGKGRQAAALIRWARENKKKVLFVTESSKLFSSMYADLKDINTDYLPYVVNDDTEANITNDDGVKIIPKPSLSAHNALWKSDKYELPKDKKGRQYDVLMMTYSQAQNANKGNARNKLEWISEYAKDAIVIMDESHNASGNSNRGEYFKGLVKNAGGVTFLSATYAKRPDNMMLYAMRSSLAAVNMPQEAMFEAIKQYGVPMQEILANGLFGSGEMIRRERDMSDVKTTWCDAKEVYSEDEYVKSRKTSDKTIDVVNDIIDFQRTYVDPIVKKLEESFEEQNAAAAITGMPMTHCSNSPYSGQVSNVVNLLTYGLKAKKAANMAIEQIKAGKKPVIAVENTLGSYVDDIEGDVDNAGFGMVFNKGVKFALRYNIAQYLQNPDSGKYEKDKDSEQIYDAEDELDGAGQLALGALRQKIESYIGDTDIEQLSMSPIDLVKEMLSDAGYKCGEITGRTKCLAKNENGTYRSESIKIKKKDAANKFNGGSASNPMKNEETYDALILNVAGATGISLHSSNKFGDQKPRSMIILQPARDVNIEVQMRGRIDRTGQIHRGEYFYVTSPIPAEQKITMMLKQKLASLDANAVGTEEVSSNKVDAHDMDNKYGDETAKEFLLDHLNDVNAFLENGLRYNNKTREWEGREGLLYDVLKGMQRLDCDTQEFIIEELTTRYADKIEYLNQNGINDLKTSVMKLDAKTIDKAMFIKGKDDESENEFAHNTNLERVEVNVLKKPLRSNDVQDRMKKFDVFNEDGTLDTNYGVGKVSDKVQDVVIEMLDARREKLDESEKKLEEKIRKSHPKTDGETEEEYDAKISKWPSLVDLKGRNDDIYNQYKADISKQQNMVIHASLYLKPGMPYLVPLTDELKDNAPMSFGRFIGFEMKNGQPRNIQAVFAVKDSRATINIPCVNSSKVIDKIIDGRGDPMLTELYYDEHSNYMSYDNPNLMKRINEWWDARIPKNTNRQHRFMITGNILQACGSLGKYKGQIVTFTRKNDNGETNAERGMLLAENFDPENFKVRSAVKKSDIWDSYKELKDELSSISASRQGNNLIVKFKKRKGQKLIDHPVLQDTELADIAMDASDGTKYSKGKDDIAMMFSEKNVDKALDLLYRNHSFTKERFFIMPNSSEKPDAIIRTNKPYKDVIEELKGKYGHSKFSVIREIDRMLKQYKMDVDNEDLKNKIREAVQLRQAYYRQQYANETDDRLAWKVLIEDRNIENYTNYVDKAETDEDLRYYKGQREDHYNIREAMIEELESRGIKGNAYHLEQGDWSAKGAKEFFDKLNDTSTAEGNANKAIMDAVYDKIKDLPMNIVLDEKIDECTGGQAAGKVIEYNWKYMNADYITDQQKANTILHEMIHTVTVYACKAVENNMEHLLKPEMVEAVNELKQIFFQISDQKVFKHDTYIDYGVSNVYEMLSEAGSNESFRNDLRQAGLWTRILDGILRFFGFERTGAKKVDAYGSIKQRLDDLIEGFNAQAWAEYYKGSRYGEYGKKLETESPINPDAVSRREKSFNDAIAKGDEALARINLKGIAELNGYGYEGWHGSPNVDITEFVDGKRGWRPEHSLDEVAEAGWFTDSEEGSKRYGGGKYGGRSYHVFIRMKKPLHIYGNSELVGDAINKWNDAKSARDKSLEDNDFLNGKQRQTFKDAKQEFDDVYNGNEPLAKLKQMCEEAMKEYPESKTIGEAFRKKLKAHGYDGVVMHDTAADGAKGETWYLPTDAGNNIKSADLITKDDNGNVIPIEERFSDSKDIRYKTSQYDSEVSRTFDETQPLRAEAHDVINSLGGKGKVFGSADELDAEGKRALKENSRAMGWYNQKTGEVCVYLPNCRSRYDVQRVVQHEKVGHEGLRGLMGQEGYKKFMQKIWMGLDAETRKELIDKHGMNYLLCTDEYLAEKAETFNDADRSFWQKVKDTWNDVMRSLGFKQSSTEDDIRTALWLSKNRLENKTGNIEYKIRKAAFEAKLKKYKPSDFISKDGRTFADSQAKEFDMKEFIFSSRMTDEDREKMMREYTLKGKSDIRRYNDRLQAFSYAWGEAHGDRLKAARILLEVVTGKTGNDIPEEYNIVNKLEALASVNRQAQEAFAREQLDPLCKTIDNLQRHFDGNNARERYENLEMYAYIKHALERNRVFAVRDFCKKLYDSDDAADTALADTIIKDFNDVRNTARADLDAGNITLSDYYNRLDTFIGGHIDGYDAGKADRSGLSDFDAEELNKLGIPTGTKGEYNDAVAIDHIMDCETKMGADNAKELWDKINAISSSNVKREYEAGNIDKQTREKLDGMFHWYLPLRGFNAESAEDVYGYIHRNVGTRLSTEVKANGRNSLAKTPISTLAAMADFSIMNCNRNLVKQSLVRLARHSKSNLISEYDVWYHKVVKGGVETLEATYPELREDMTPAEIEQAIEQHEADIQQNIDNGETYVKLKDEKTNSPYRIVSSKDKEQHFVSCNINGKRVTVIVHGNPRAAQAVNGMVHDKSWKGWSNINRFMSQMMTSYSWTFMMRNAARDLEYASASGFIADFNKGEKWNRDFWSVYGSLATTVNATGIAGNRLDGKMSGMLNLFKRYREGKLDVVNNEVDKYFKEFVEGGGMTGYTQLHTVEDYAKNINNTISGGFNRFKNSNNKFVKYGTMSAEALLKAPKMIFDMAETANEAVENHARFAAYCASRMEHRSVSRSIHDAKEISVNFNRTGAGSGTLSLRTENESWLWKANKNVAALSANFMRNAMWFYNPAVQGMSRNVDLFWKGDAKQKARFMFAQVAVPAALMSLMAYSSAVVASYDTDDEKKKYGENPLDQLPDFVRRDNMCLYVGHGRFVMMPLAIELRAAYGMADVLDRMRRGLPSEKGYMWEFYEQLTQLTPMDLGGGGKVAWNSGWGSVLGTITPSNLQPIIACMTNVKWTGSPVSGRNSYNASKAEWQRTMSTTNPMYVDVARELSIMSGDDIIGDKEGVSGGHIDINPDIAQYLVESYTGGPGKELGEIMGLLSDDIDLTKLPIAKAFSRSARPENSMAVTRSRWYRYAEAYKSETKPWLSGFKKFGETAEYRALMDSPKGKIGNVVKHYEKSIQREQERKNKTSNLNEKKLHQERLNSLICEAIEQIDRIENSK